MTSAPRSASVIVQKGPLSTRVRSMTRIPCSGCMRNLLHSTVQVALGRDGACVETSAFVQYTYDLPQSPVAGAHKGPHSASAPPPPLRETHDTNAASGPATT